MEFTGTIYVPPTNLSDANSTTYIYPLITLALSVSSSALSIIGGLVIIVTFILLPEIRNFTRQLVFCLTVADVLTASGIFMSVIRYFNMHNEVVRNYQVEKGLCKAQSTLTTLSSLVSFFLTSIIAIYICDTVTNQSDRLNKRRWLIFFNLISWILPGAIVIAALASNVLGGDATPNGGTGPWCWIAEDVDNSVTWMFITGKGWEIACYLITSSIYILLKFYIFRHHRKKTFHAIHISLRDEDKNFLYVWLILYVLRFWGTLRFILSIAIEPSGEESYMEVFLYLQAIGDPAQAFCNFLLFCVFDKTVRTRMVQKFVCCNKICRDDQNMTLLEHNSNEINAQPDSETSYGSVKTI